MQTSNMIVSVTDVTEITVDGILRMDGFPYFQLIFVTKDGYAISQEVCEVPFSAGDVIFVTPGKYFGIRCDGEMQVVMISFKADEIRSFIHYCRFKEFNIIKCNSKVETAFEEDFSALLELLIKAWDSSIPTRSQKLSSVLYLMLSFLGGISIESQLITKSLDDTFREAVTDYIQTHYRKPHFGMEPFAVFMADSEENINRNIIRLFGCDYDELFRRTRLENSKHLLFFYAHKGIDYVAKNLGYTAGAEFEHDFCKEFAMTTNDFLALYYGK